MQTITVGDLIARYDVFFLDAYGVLVRTSGALPGAAAFLHALAAANKEHLILSNDASRSPDTAWKRYTGFGLPIERERILTSGQLLVDHFAAEGLVGAPTIVLGTEDSRFYVRAAGGRIVAASDAAARVVVAADDDGFDFLETMNDVTTVLLARLARGERTHLVLPNPDLIFPRGPDAFGLTAGSIAAMLEPVIRLRDPQETHRFIPLGKPHAPMFEAAVRRFPGVDRRRMVMIGDQLGTDILGAHRFGLDSVFVETGIGRLVDFERSEVKPTYTLAGFAALESR